MDRDVRVFSIKSAVLKWSSGGKRLFRCETDHGSVALLIIGHEEFFYRWNPAFNSKPVYDHDTDSWIFEGKSLEDYPMFNLLEKGA